MSPRVRRLAPLVVASALAFGCGRGAPEKAAAHETKAAAAKPAVEGAMCAEHGVLEAVCTKCNPKLIPVFQAKGDWCGEHGFPESFCPLCHPERGGKPARSVSADDAPADGTKVKLKTEDVARWAGIRTVAAAAAPEGRVVAATVQIAYDATRVAEVNARSAGVVRKLLGADRSRLTAAQSRVRIAEENLERERQLAQKDYTTRRDVLRAQHELDAARAEAASLSASLAVVGANAGGAGGYAATTPLAGVVTRRMVTVGKLAGANEPLFQVVDTSRMWAELDVPEGDLAAVATGAEVTLSVDGLLGRTFRGPVSYLAPEVDPHTRTARARVALENADGALRANMYGQARIAAGDGRPVVLVPRAAVQRAKGATLAFVRLAPDQFEARRVELGAGRDDAVEVTKGVRPGEQVVTEGSFLLKTETLKGSIGAGCCAVD